MKINKNLIVIIAIGLIFRLLVLVIFPFVPPVMDAAGYDEIGWNIASGNGYKVNGEVTVRRAPGYPVFLAGVYKMFGHSYTAVRIIQALLYSISVLFLFKICLFYFSKKVSYLAAWLFTLYPAFLNYHGLLLSENLYIPLLLLAVYFLIRAEKDKNLKDYMFAGIFCGLGALTRPTLSLFPFFLIAVRLLFINKKNLSKLSIFLLIFIILAGSWIVRDYMVKGKFYLIAGGGRHSVYAGTVKEWGGKVQNIPGNSKKKSEDDKSLTRSIKNIAGDPFNYTLMTLKKLPVYWMGGHTFIWGFDKSLGEFNEKREFGMFLGKAGLLLIHNLLLLLGIIGIILTAKYYKKYYILYGLLLYYTVVHMMTSSVSRHHLPVIPYLLIFTAYAINYFYSKFKLKHNI